MYYINTVGLVRFEFYSVSDRVFDTWLNRPQHTEHHSYYVRVRSAPCNREEDELLG